MYDTEIEFEGIKFRTDPVDSKKEGQNLMSILWEEQCLQWHFSKNHIRKAIHESEGSIDFLDVGTGSGVWSLLVKKNTQAQNILAIDINPRAIRFAKENSISNGLDITVKQEFYNIQTTQHKSAKVIGIYPPYHIYPSELEPKIPLHARGGINGQQLLKEELTVANYHLADNGIIILNQGCLGRDGSPEFLRYIPNIMDDCSITWTNILPSTKTEEFLSAVYGKRFTDFQEEVSQNFPELYLCNLIIKRDGQKDIKKIEHKIDLKGRTWNDRYAIHREITRHAIPKMPIELYK